MYFHLSSVIQVEKSVRHRAQRVLGALLLDLCEVARELQADADVVLCNAELVEQFQNRKCIVKPTLHPPTLPDSAMRSFWNVFCASLTWYEYVSICSRSLRLIAAGSDEIKGSRR